VISLQQALCRSISFWYLFFVQLQCIQWDLSLAVSSSVDDAAPQGMCDGFWNHEFTIHDSLQQLYLLCFSYPALMALFPNIQSKWICQCSAVPNLFLVDVAHFVLKTRTHAFVCYVHYAFVAGFVHLSHR
jgi:hypothetical protein